MSLISPVGIFDSGLGGLTVLKALASRHPHTSFVYFGDTARVPYGTKSAQIVQRFALENSLFLLEKNVNQIIIACNTATAHALDFLQRTLKIPVTGVIKAGVHSALKQTRGRIGIVATEGTINTNDYQNMLKSLDPHLYIVAKATNLWVPLIEEDYANKSLLEKILAEDLSFVQEHNLDSLILGCTHYPLIKPLLQKICPGVNLVDSADALASELLLESPQNKELAPCRLYFSDLSPRTSQLVARFMQGVNYTLSAST